MHRGRIKITMLQIKYDEVLELVNFEEVIEVMQKCFIEYTKGEISQVERSVQVLPDGYNKNIFAIMPAYLGKNRYFGAKIITAFPDNRKQNLNSHLGEILIFNSSNGIPVAMIDADSITWMRTAAVTALATDYLAPKNATQLTLIGAGQQASSHLKAIKCIRDIEKVYVYDMYEASRITFINRMRAEFPEITFINCSSLQSAVENSEIICTLTPSKEPFLDLSLVPKGAHINAIGTFTPDSRELKSDLVSSGKVFVDDYKATLSESGDILIPISEGNFSKDKIVASLGEVVSGNYNANRKKEDITIFDAVGLAIEDLSCAEYIYNKKVKSDEI